MRILILGASGAHGRALAEKLAQRGALCGDAIRRLGLADIHDPELVSADFPVVSAGFDIADRAALDRAQAEGWDAIFHLSETPEPQTRDDFVSGLRGNFFGSFNVMESCRAVRDRPLLIFGSSMAAGAETPPGGYDAQKRIAELLLLDYSRRGFLDGRILRLGDEPAPDALIAAASADESALPESRVL